jgi:hypothetical protein
VNFRLLAIVVLAVVTSPSTALAIDGPSLVVSDLTGYVHASSAIDGEIDGATLVEASGKSADATTLDRARGLDGEGRSWRSTDGKTVAIALVLDCDDYSAATTLAAGMTVAAWQNGIPFAPGLSGAGGVSIDQDGQHTYSVFWRQGTLIAFTSVSGPDAARAAADVTVLAGLEADLLQDAIGGVRVTMAAPEGRPAKPSGPRDFTTWIVVTLTSILVAVVGVAVLARRHPPRPPMPPLPSLPISD